jgi:selenocysteine-specific elongation factor
MPMSSHEMALALGLPRPEVADELNRAKLERLKVGAETWFVTPDALDALVSSIDAELTRFHAENPAASAIPTPALRDRVDRRLEPRVFDALLGVAQARGAAVVESGRARHPKAAAGALAAEQAAASALMERLAAAGLEPPAVAELAADSGVEPGVARKVLGELAGEGRLERITSDLYFSAEAYSDARERVRAALALAPDGATAAELRDALSVSRKFAIPLLEHMDATGFTKRTGDLRTLRG